MIFDKTTTADCVIPPEPQPDPRCSDADYALAHPATCSSALILKPSRISLCRLESVRFTVFEYRNGAETSLTSGLVFTSSNPAVLPVGVNSGSGTALMAGAVNVTVTRLADGLKATAAVTVLNETNCCDEIVVATALVIDNSFSASMPFGGDYLTRLDFAKAAAKEYASTILNVLGIPKDAIKVWMIDETATDLLGLFSQDTTEIAAAVDGVEQGFIKTNLLPLFTAVAADLNTTEAAANRRVLFLLSDGGHTLNTDRQAIIDAASAFRAAGGYVVVMGLRASGDGFDLLERIATPGFFINATRVPTAAEAEAIPRPVNPLSELNYLKSILCVGRCIPAGDEYVNDPSFDYSTYTNWDVARGQTNLFGPGLLDVLPGSGLYVELAGSGTAATVLRTIDSFELQAGWVYKIQFKAAGNQRAPVPGQQLKVYVREAGAADGDPNLFEQIVAPAWDQPFQQYAFTFNAIGDVTVRLYLEQLYDGAPPPLGNLIDDILFQDASTLTTLLSDNFDDENLVYVTPRCGPSGALDAIDDPEPPAASLYFDSGDAVGGGGASLVPDMTTNTAPSGEALGSPFPGVNDFLAFDQDAATWWSKAPAIQADLSYADPPWISYTFDAPAAVGSYSIQGSTTVFGPVSNSPQDFQLQGSDNGVDWTTVDSRTDEILWGSNEIRTYVVQNPGSDLSYRLYVTKGQTATLAFPGGKQLDIAELTLYAEGSGETYQYAVSYLTQEGETAATRLAVSGDNTTVAYTNSVIRVDMLEIPGERVTRKRLWRSLGVTPGAYDPNATLYLLAELDPSQTIYLDSERSGFFQARYDSSITAPGANTTTVQAGVLGYGYQPCCSYESSTDLIPVMASNTAPSGEVKTSIPGSADVENWIVFDGSEITHVAGTLPAWIQYKFDAPKRISGYRFLAYDVNAGPGAWTLAASNDGMAWATLDTRTHGAWIPSVTETFGVSPVESYSYYRWTFTGLVEGEVTFDLAEIQLVAGLTDDCPACNIMPPEAQAPDPSPQTDPETGTPPTVFTSTKEECAECPPDTINSINLVSPMKSDTTDFNSVNRGLPSGIANASSATADYNAWKAFDGLVNSALSLVSNPWATTEAMPQWLRYKFPAAAVVRAYSVTANKASLAPLNWKLQGSNNGTAWTDLDTRSAQVWFDYQHKNFSFTNEAAYLYYRLYVTAAAAGASGLEVSELQLFATGGVSAGDRKCATATRSGLSRAEADRLASEAALAAARALLNCTRMYSATISHTAVCPLGTYGNPVTKVVTKTSLVSEQDAIDQATAEAIALSEVERDCTLSNNAQQITINDNAGTGLRQATPYPSVKYISAAGDPPVVVKITVTIYGFNHNSPRDVRIILRSPSGACVELMRNCGGDPPSGIGAGGIDLIFDDDGVPIPELGPLVAGVYTPTQFGAAAAFPLLGPTPYGTNLGLFTGGGYVGAWSLWVCDDFTLWGGTITGWDLVINP